MATDLYLDKLPELEKEFRKEAAFAARLSETPENWAQELTSELYKQLPYLSDYEMLVNLDRVDPQRGYAFGYADVSNKTERPEIEHTEAGLPHIRIPLVIQERAAKPFSVFLDGDRALPLNEDRIRETLFNPSTFDLSQAQPRDPSLIEPLMPPTRSGAGMGGEYKTASVMEKQAGGGVARLRRAAAALSGSHGAEADAAKSFLSSKLNAKASGKRVARMTAKMRKVDAGTTGRPYSPAHRQLTEDVIADTKNSGIGSGARARAALEKSASNENLDERPSLLRAIAPTLSEKDVESFLNKVASDPTFRAGLKRAGVVGDVVEVFDKTKRASAEERLEYIASKIEPSVVTIHKFPGGEFLIKAANVNALDPAAMKGQVVPQQDAGQMIGQDNAQAMMPGQTATVVPQPVEPEMPVLDRGKPVDEFGEYKVIDSLGTQIMGWVFPETLSWDGSFSPQPVALFTNGSAYAVQDSIVGEMVGKGSNLPIDRPIGDGCFYSVEHGGAIATAPLTVRSMLAGPDGQPRIIATDLFGNQIQISQLQGLTAPQRISNVEFGIPATWKFMRLNNQTQLQGGGQASAEQMGPGADMQPDMGGMSDAPKPAKPQGKPQDKKQDKKPDKAGAKPAAKKEAPKEEKPTVQVNVGAKARQEKTAATLWYNGGYNIDGGCGLHKLADELKYDMSPVDAEFMLGLLGVDGHLAKQKVAEARRKGSIKLAGLKTITLASERYQGAVKTASRQLQRLPNLRRDLLKEAAALQDTSTVNNLLALNFINPENVSTFVDYLPELEETSQKLSEMLLYSYLGMNELPEGAISRSMRGVEEVISGLKNLSETGSYMEN